MIEFSYSSSPVKWLLSGICVFGMFDWFLDLPCFLNLLGERFLSWISIWILKRFMWSMICCSSLDLWIYSTSKIAFLLLSSCKLVRLSNRFERFLWSWSFFMFSFLFFKLYLIYWTIFLIEFYIFFLSLFESLSSICLSYELTDIYFLWVAK